MALGVGFLFLLSISLSSFLQWASSIEILVQTLDELMGGPIFPVLLRLLPLIISFGIFLAIYKFLPYTKTYWRYVWLGSALAALLFEWQRDFHRRFDDMNLLLRYHFGSWR